MQQQLKFMIKAKQTGMIASQFSFFSIRDKR